MKKKLTTLVVLFFGFVAVAQQTPQYSLTQQNLYLANPSVAGLSGSLEAVGMMRQQWVGLEGSPATQLLTITMPIPYISSGFGMSFENDVIGVRRTTAFNASWNWVGKLRGGKLSVGVQGGLFQMGIDGAKLRTPTGNYSLGGINHRDQILATTQLNAQTVTFGGGAFLELDNFSLGISSQHLQAPTLSFEGAQQISWQLQRTYLASAGYHWEIGSLRFSPFVFVRSDLSRTQYDWSLSVKWNDNIFLGGAFRDFNFSQPESVVLFGGLKLSEKWSLAYAYDISLSALRVVEEGTHEFMFKYNWGKDVGKGKLPAVIFNPRF